MDAHKLQLKIYLTPESAQAVDLEAVIPVFHRWIKQRPEWFEKQQSVRRVNVISTATGDVIVKGSKILQN